MGERKAQIGDIVHVMHMGCIAGIVVATGEDGTQIQRFPARAIEDGGDWMLVKPTSEAYNSLHSARPTSGWHWPDEHVG